MEGSAALPSLSVTTLSAEFFDSAGSRCYGPWSEMWCNSFEQAAPVRSFPSFKRQKNFTGLYYAATMDAHVGFESWLKRDVAMTLDFDSRVGGLITQQIHGQARYRQCKHRGRDVDRGVPGRPGCDAATTAPRRRPSLPSASSTRQVHQLSVPRGPRPGTSAGLGCRTSRWFARCGIRYLVRTVLWGDVVD
jgi:hypothetical protein